MGNNNYNNGINMSQNDIDTLNLLFIQIRAQAVNILSNLLAYKATIEGIEVIYSQYNNNSNEVPNPDITALQSVYLGLFAQLVFTQLGLSKYNLQYERYLNNEIDYSLQPNIDINISNIFGIISFYYLINGIEGIYERDLSQPIVGGR